MNNYSKSSRPVVLIILLFSLIAYSSASNGVSFVKTKIYLINWTEESPIGFSIQDVRNQPNIFIESFVVQNAVDEWLGIDKFETTEKLNYSPNIYLIIEILFEDKTETYYGDKFYIYNSDFSMKKEIDCNFKLSLLPNLWLSKKALLGREEWICGIKNS